MQIFIKMVCHRLSGLALSLLLISGCAQYSAQPSIKSNQLQQTQQQQAQELAAQQSLLKQQAEQLQLLQQQLLSQSQQQLVNQKQLLSLAAENSKAASLAAPAPVNSSCNIDGKLLLGSAEWVWLKPAEMVLRARIDTGAATSSLSTANVEKFERDGKNWVRFDLVQEGLASINLEARLLRTVKIRQASMQHGERRYVVRLALQLGDFVEEAEFTLADRANMRYPILLGREFLRDVAVVDVAKKYIQRKPQSTQEVGFLSAGAVR